MKLLIHTLLVSSTLILNAQFAVAKDKALLDALNAEADETSMVEDKSLNSTDSEPSITAKGITDYNALEKKVAEQIKGLLKSPDSDQKIDSKLENIVSSALLQGNKMNDIQSAVSAAMNDIKKASVKAGDASKAAIESAGKTLESIVAEKKIKTPVKQLNSAPTNAVIIPNTVTVLKGENLYKIAQRVYGSGRKYLDLYNANKDVLSNPDMIRVGQVLKVP